MFPSYVYENPLLVPIRDFVSGNMDISDFVALYNQDNTIGDFFDYIIEYIETNNLPIKRITLCIKNVNQNEPFEARSNVEEFIKEYAQSFIDLSNEWKKNPPKVSAYLKRLNHLTAFGALLIHSTVSDIYYQIDTELVRTERYSKEHSFMLDVLPGYLSGGVSSENYVSQYILPKYPETMKKGERKRLVKEEIKLAFKRDTKGYPRWLQMPEWPIGSDKKPMVYVSQKSFRDYTEYYFRDAVTNEKYTVTQWW